MARFFEFCKAHFIEENLDFFLAVDEWKRGDFATEQERNEQARHLVAEFIVPEAPEVCLLASLLASSRDWLLFSCVVSLVAEQPINIDAATRQRTTNAVLHADKHISIHAFDE